MLKLIYFAAILTLLGSITGISQVQSSNKASGNASSKNSVRKGQDELISSGTVLDARLVNTIDVRKSKVGDKVILKTTKSLKAGGDIAIAKGSTLIGRITEVQRRTKDNGESRIAMILDRIEGKNLSAPISVSVLSMTTARVAASSNDTFADAGLMSSSGSSAQSRGSGGGGLLGGVGNTVGGVVNSTAATTGGIVGGVTQTAGGTLGGVTRTAGDSAGIIGRTVNGIQISQSLEGSASGSTAFSSSNRDVRIEKGATFNIQFNSSVQK